MQSRFLRRYLCVALVLCAAGPALPAAAPEPKEKNVFKTDTATLTLGRDGKVYLGSTGEPWLILRLNRDGSERRVNNALPALMNVAANASGMMATANAGGLHMLTLYDPDFYCLWAMGKIYGGAEGIGMSAPAHVEAGVGDFYATDQYRDRILRCGAFGKRTAIYRIPREDAKNGEIRDFRVCEGKSLLFVLTADGLIRCFDVRGKEWNLDAKKLWEIKSDVKWAKPGAPGGSGAFDVDDDGVLYTTDGKSEVIKRFTPDGKPKESLKLQLTDTLKPAQAEGGFYALRVGAGDILLKRAHPSELFQHYDLATGALKNVADLHDPPDKTPPPLRVLFIGNSQIASWGFSLPAIVEELSQSEKEGIPRIEASEIVLFGSSLKDEWTQAEGIHMILNGRWDWVVIHESVLQPDKDQMFEYMRKFGGMVGMTKAKMLILATGDHEKKRENHAVMYANALTMARELKCRVAGGGMAWLKAWDKKKDLDLHSQDRWHPGARGFYLNACVIYAALTGRSPEGLDPYVLSPEDAKLLQQAATEQAAEDRKAEAMPATEPEKK